MKTFFDHLANLSEGLVVVDKDARVIWMNAAYPKLLGIEDIGPMMGRPVEEVIPNSLLRSVVGSGHADMLDIMDFGDQTLAVMRIPFRDDAGNIIGGIGMTLAHARHLLPIISRYRQLRADLAQAKRKLAAARRTRYTLSNFIGDTPACLELKRLSRRAARTNSCVLLLGETGTGKEMLAQAIHAMSPRADGPFIAVNVAAIPETLMEAEFFGTAAGAYTGADRRAREGKVQLADGGTIFLDEVGDMSPSLQAKLLRVLQEKEVEPVGSNQLIAVDVRVIAATSRDLPAMVAAGEFRSDLYYRLNVLTLIIPPLRDRLNDLPALCERLLEQHCRELGLPPREISAAAIELLRQHAWPGNVRELSNVLERALLHSDSDLIDAPDLGNILPELRRARHAAAEPGGEMPGTLGEALAKAEKSAIAATLARCNGNKSLAAKQLGISRASLYEKLAALGLG
ncbi:MAG: sigma-54 interaction domain-containing protein [Betaproteobacteria bacterium]